MIGRWRRRPREVLPPDLPVPLARADGRTINGNAAWRVLFGADPNTALSPDSATMLARAIADGLAGRVPEPLPDLHRAGAAVATLRLRLYPLPDQAVLLLAEDRAEVATLQAQLAQSQRLQAVGEFAGGIGHDFNNLLAAVLGATDAIADRAPDADTAADLGIIRASAERGAALVRQLLAFGGQQTLQPVAVSVNPAIAAVAGMLQRLLPSSVRLRLDLETPGRAVLIDPTQFDQILLNLCVNARDALPQGGDLVLSSGHATVLQPLPGLPDTIAPGRYVTVTVQDSGPGIPPDVLPRIFDPFFTTKAATGGTGLGLATVLGIVRQSGGFLAVDSGAPGGASFRLYLPRHDAPTAAPPPPATPRVGSGPSGGTVLLVDDEDALRQLAERLLIRRGWTVLAAEDAAAALALLAATPAIDAIVTDMVMPGMDGASLVREVRTRLSRPDLPAIIVSGYAEASLRAQIGTTATIFLPKPYRLAEMADKLAELTGESHAAKNPA